MNIYDKYDNADYMVFVLGYDLLQNYGGYTLGLSCDEMYDFCTFVYKKFMQSEEFNDNTKSEYECLEDFVSGARTKLDLFHEWEESLR